MSALPYLVRNVRFSIPLDTPRLMEDYIQPEFIDSYTGISSERMAENVARKYGVTRKDVDEFTVRSCVKWKAAQENDTFQDELTSISVKIQNKDITVDRDDVNATNVEELGTLPPIVEDGFVVTNGNRAPPADGAAAVILAHTAAVQDHSLSPLARVAGWCCIGVNPGDTASAAVTAVKMLLEKDGCSVGDALVEINETFAAQTLLASRQLDIPGDDLNASGGALAIGHPVAASGARMVAHLVHQLRKHNTKKAIAASSCGGGQGIAIMLEQL